VVSKYTPSTTSVLNEMRLDPNQALKLALKRKEEGNFSKSAIVLGKAFYMLDYKAIGYKLECEPEYLFTFLDKREVEVKIEAF